LKVELSAARPKAGRRGRAVALAVVVGLAVAALLWFVPPAQ
jgi:hypothetical protein